MRSDTEGYSSEDSKRKREEIERELTDTLKRSKRMIRTPPREKQEEESKLDKLTEMMAELMKDAKEIKEDQKKFHNELTQIKKENEALKVENQMIKTELSDIQTRVEKLEKEKIRNNITVTGLEIDTIDRKEVKDILENFLKEFGTIIRVKNAFKIGPRTYKIELESFEEKMEIMKNKNGLRARKERIFINSELTRTEWETQRRLKQIANQERIKGNITKVGHQKIIINGAEYNWEKEKGELRKREPRGKVEGANSKN